ncbi:hypothetical protein GCM10009660_47170 [Catellatospora bangladeshensis]
MAAFRGAAVAWDDEPRWPLARTGPQGDRDDGVPATARSRCSVWATGARAPSRDDRVTESTYRIGR